jgi:replication-associated recombination protein RarA
MEALVTKYAPRQIADFIGLAPVKAIMTAFIRDPYSAAFLMMGSPGTGKSSLAMCVAETIRTKHGCAIHHMKSADSSVDAIEKLIHDCQMAPMLGGRWHVAIIEEAGSIGPAAQKAWLSELDSLPPDAIVLFTANPFVIGANGRITPHALKDRFLSRVRTLNFTEPSIEEMVDFLEKVWQFETPHGRRGFRHNGKAVSPPDFTAIARAAAGNIRSALMTLETEILVPGSFVEPPKPVSVPIQSRGNAVNVVSIGRTNACHTPRAENQRLRDQAIKLKQQGLSLKDIAMKIGAPASSVWRWTHAA